ncbi:MAG: cyclic nucleotide-binding domain-containing protein [Elusimicrobiota bacterium]
MLYEEKLKLIKALKPLQGIPERQLSGLAEFLRPKPLQDGAVVFEEGSIGMSLYFVSNGQVRICKRAAGGGRMDLVMLGPGDFFGEMALIAEASRSASAIAVGPTLVFELFRGDLDRWAKASSQQAVQFFAALVHLQSQRLRHTSDELTLHCDLEDILLDPDKAPAASLPQTLERIVRHLGGPWSAAVYLAAGGASPVASSGKFSFDDAARKVLAGTAAASAWLDPATYHVKLVSKEKPLGHLLVHSETPVAKGVQDEIGRNLDSAARMVSLVLSVRQPAG